MKNLYTKTIEILQRNGKNESDIRWVGNKDKYFEPFEWLRLKDIFGTGSDCIEPGLLVVGDDWWLEGYDDFDEWFWEFKTMPKKPIVGTNSIDIITYK